MRTSVVVLALAGVLLTGSNDTASAASIEGSWRGSGYISPASGKREKVRCRVTYKRLTKKVFRVVAVCASTAGKIRQTGEVLRVNSTRYVGDFYNSEYDVSGRVRVIVRGSRQTVSFSSKTGKGRIKLRKR